MGDNQPGPSEREKRRLLTTPRTDTSERGGSSGGFAGYRAASLAANGHRRPPPSRHNGPRKTRQDGTSSHVCHHPATQLVRLTVKQVHTELVLDFVDPGGIGGTTTCSPVPVACPGAVPELDKGKRESQAGEDRPTPVTATQFTRSPQ
jgi:hypothetical protein